MASKLWTTFNIPLSEEALFAHEDFSTTDDIAELYKGIFEEKRDANNVKLCMWNHIESIKGTFIHFITGTVAHVDEEQKVVVLRATMMKYEQEGLLFPMYTKASGVIVVDGKNFMFLDHRKWNILCMTVEKNPDTVKQFQTRTNEQLMASLIVPLNVSNVSYKHIELPSSVVQWCKDNQIAFANK